VVFCF